MEARVDSRAPQGGPAAAKVVALRGANVFICTLGVTRELEPQRARAMADNIHTAFNARLRTCRWRGARQWRLVATVRPAEGHAHVDLYLIVERGRPARCDNVYGAWRALCLHRCGAQFKDLAAAGRGYWHPVGDGTAFFLDCRGFVGGFAAALESVQAAVSGCHASVSDDLRPAPRLSSVGPAAK